MTYHQPDNPILFEDDRPPFFAVDHRLIHEWYPILRSTGLALYCTYCSLASGRDKAYPSLRLIRSHMSVSLATVVDYNHLLTWCELLHITPGQDGLANEYRILKPPSATPEALDRLRAHIETDIDQKTADLEAEIKKVRAAGLKKEADRLKTALPERTKFHEMILRRLDNWKPISAHFRNGQAGPRSQLVHPAQLSLLNDQEPTAPTPANPPSQYETAVLKWMGFDGRLTAKDLQPSPTLLLAWALWVRGDTKADNPVGVARAKWRQREWPAGIDVAFVEDSSEWLLKQEEVTSHDLDLILREMKQYGGKLSRQVPAELEGIVLR